VPAVLSKNIYRPAKGEDLGISFKASEDGRVAVRVYTLSGELVQPVFESEVKAGLWYQTNWNGRNSEGELVASGVYFVSVKGAGVKSIRRVIVLK
jgi:flagellar hook assembly protein FlgD